MNSLKAAVIAAERERIEAAGFPYPIRKPPLGPFLRPSNQRETSGRPER